MRHHFITMRILSYALLLSASFCVTACSDATDPAAQQAPAPSMRERNQWAGTYRTTLPGADGRDRDVMVTLQQNNHFRLQVSSGKDAVPFVVCGEMNWTDGEHLTLPTGNGTYRNYVVEKDALLLLDEQGKAVAGEGADRYRLAKQKDDYRLPTIEGTKWLLTDLYGRQGAVVPHGDEYLQFNGSSLMAYSGYNEVSAEYKLDPTTAKLSIGSLSLTPKGKADGSSDNAFLGALSSVRGCDVVDGQLLLFNKLGDVVARFKAA